MWYFSSTYAILVMLELKDIDKTVFDRPKYISFRWNSYIKIFYLGDNYIACFDP